MNNLVAIKLILIRNMVYFKVNTTLFDIISKARVTVGCTKHCDR